MFIEVLMPDKKGELIHKHVNLSTATVIHDINPEASDNKGKFRSVIFMPNGYAAYSNLTAAQLITLQEGAVVSERSIITEGN